MGKARQFSVVIHTMIDALFSVLRCPYIADY